MFSSKIISKLQYYYLEDLNIKNLCNHFDYKKYSISLLQQRILGQYADLNLDRDSFISFLLGTEDYRSYESKDIICSSNFVLQKDFYEAWKNCKKQRYINTSNNRHCPVWFINEKIVVSIVNLRALQKIVLTKQN